MQRKKRRVEFKMSAPYARQVLLSGDFNNWSENADIMRRDATGIWSKTKMLAPGKHEFKYIVDGQWTLNGDLQDIVTNHYGTDNHFIDVSPSRPVKGRKKK